MAKKSKKTKRSEINEAIVLDPVLPIAAGFEWPGVKQGEAREIMQNTRLVMLEIPYRALFGMWEHIERVAARDYPKYIGLKGSMEEHAIADLEAVHAIRQAVAGVEIPRYSEKQARKIRKAQAEEDERQAEAARKARAAKAAKVKGEDVPVSADGVIVTKGLETNADGVPIECPQCGPNRTILKRKSKKTGEKTWKCADCEFSWPRRSPRKAPESPPKRYTAPEASTSTGKRQKAAQKPKKTGKKGSKKKL